jgi:Domain of unknown function (DUF4386)
MAVSTNHQTRRDAADRRLYGLSGLLLLAQFVFMGGAFFILMPSINWPASLDEKPAVILPLILEQAGPVFAGYSSYVLHALLLIPLAVTLRSTLKMSPVLGGMAVALGVLAGLAKALGITRWIFLMPGLAAAYTNPEASAVTKDTIAVVFDAFNAYAGGVGETLGVGIFTGLWTLLVSVALMRLGGGARVIGLVGLVAAAGLLLTLLSVFGVENPLFLTVSGAIWQVWAVTLAVWHFRAQH